MLRLWPFILFTLAFTMYGCNTEKPINFDCSDTSECPKYTECRVKRCRGWFDHSPEAIVSVNPANAKIGETVILDGSGSKDPENAPLGYQWLLVSRPENSKTTILSPRDEKTSIVVDVPGDYKVQLEVTDGRNGPIPSAIVTVRASE